MSRNISLGMIDLLSCFTAREGLDRASKKAKELWLACQMLKNTLKVGNLGEPSSNLNLKPLDQELNAIMKAAGEANPFVQQLVHSVPAEALTRGVYTEEALRERFQKACCIIIIIH